ALVLELDTQCLGDELRDLAATQTGQVSGEELGVVGDVQTHDQRALLGCGEGVEDRSGGLGVDPDVELSSGRRVAWMVEGGAHECELPQQSWQLGLLAQGERDVRERPGRYKHQLSGVHSRLLDDQLRAVAIRDRRTRWGWIGIAEPPGAMACRGAQRHHERSFTAHGDRDVAHTAELEHGQRVRRGLRRLDVAGTTCDRDELDVRLRDGEHARDPVVHAGIDVHEDRKRHSRNTISCVRVAFVISERAEGLTEERLEHYRKVERCLAGIARAEITTAHYAELDSVDADATVLSGSYDPWSSHDPQALQRFRAALRARKGPILGICAGMQLLATAAGAEVAAAAVATGPIFAPVDVLDGSDLLAGLDDRISVWQHHSDEVLAPPAGFRVLARSETCGVEALASDERPWWGTQFHPEAWTAEHPGGRTILENFFRLAEIPLR